MIRFPKSIFVLGWIVAIFPALALGLTLMPIVPAMQEWDSIWFSYYIYQVEYPLIAIGIVVLAYGLWGSWKNSGWWWRSFAIFSMILAGGLHYLSHTEASAEVMFNEPSVVRRTLIDSTSLVAETTVYIWVDLNGQIAGYPVDLVAHHHKIHDTVGGIPVLVTYCTMCHTGRVYSPIIDGVPETFRLVGANHFNAIFEEKSTGSWWYQATGECVVGPRAGAVLNDVQFFQATGTEMMMQKPARSMSVFRPDLATGERYQWARGYSLRKGDTTQALGKRSIIIGVDIAGHSCAYPMYWLVNQEQRSIIVDTVGPIIVAFYRPTTYTSAVTVYRDSVASCNVLPSHTEYWHSWNSFHPATKVWHHQ